MLYSVEELNDLSDWVAKTVVDDFGSPEKLQRDTQGKQATKIVKKILSANSCIDNRAIPWRVFVVNNDHCNAFCLPNGSIFVYTGLTDRIQEEDIMALIIGHEMAHCLLNHVPDAPAAPMCGYRFGICVRFDTDATEESACRAGSRLIRRCYGHGSRGQSIGVQ